MTESEAALATEERAVPDWTCTRCEMTVSWTAEVERPAIPATWSSEKGALYCLSCRREKAGDDALALLAEDASTQKRQQARSRAQIEFELLRVPNRDDGRIAKSCRTSVAAVRKARVRLGLQSRRPA
jgi:hypothetical protein